MSAIRKTAVVTGAAGYIGTMLVEALVKSSYNVVRVSRNDLLPIEGTTTIKADIRTPAPWSFLAKADVLYHLAGVTSAYESEKSPIDSLRATLCPIMHFLGALKAGNHKPRVVFASTATIYGVCADAVISEQNQPNPITTYDLHKFFVERQLQLAAAQGRIHGACLRLANVYGPSTTESASIDRGILNRVVSAAFRREEIKLYGDGNYLRDYVHIDDVINAFLLAGRGASQDFDIFNVATGRGVTLKTAFTHVCQVVESINGHLSNIQYEPWPQGTHEIEYRNYTYDTARIRSELNWCPMVTFENGINRMVNHLSEKRSKFS